MNVLSPDLLWIDGRCYRLPALDNNKYDDNLKNVGYEWQEHENDFENCVYDDENDEETLQKESLIQTIGDNRYELKLPIAQTFWPQIIGSKGVTKKRIENDTKTRITVPRPMEHGDISIKGSNKKDIILAEKCINAIVSSARQKLTFTHFISLPTNSDNIKRNFFRFKDSVLKCFGTDRGIDESIFQNPDKLHLTLGTLVLVDQSERKIAEDRLNEVYTQTIKPMLANLNGKKVNLEMRGIEYMNDDPSEVDVLYGKVQSFPDKNLLQNIADSIVDYFVNHKLLKLSDRQNVKLHVTLMNTLFREEELEEINVETLGFNKNKKTKKVRTTFNAVNILEKFQDYYFGHEELKTIELSVRYSTAKNGYYKSSCVVHL